MQQYAVSARKYRPSRFIDVIGQEHVTHTLQNAIKTNHLAHAFLFCGPRGVGKTTCARILAKTINCTNVLENIEACNECESCKSFNENASFNVFELDAASNNSVDNIRLLIDQVRIPPQASKYKVYVIDEVHMLSPAAFNAFLKTLEEPPSYAIFILATTEKHKILPTILSRCQIFDFYRVKSDLIAHHLHEIAKKENIKTDKEALHIIAQKSDGGMRDALSIFDRVVSFTNGEINYKNTVENLNILDYDYFFDITEKILTQDAGGLLLIFNMILDKGFEGDSMLIGLAEHFRNLLICKDQKTLKLLEYTASLKERYIQQSSIVSYSFITSLLDLINTADVQFRMARNKKLHVEMMLIRACYIQNILTSKPATVHSSESTEKKNDISEPAKTENAETPKKEIIPEIVVEKKEIKGIFNLQNIAKIVEKELEQSDLKPLNQESLNDVWLNLINEFENKSYNLVVYMKQKFPVLNNLTIEFTINSVNEKIEYEKWKMDIMEAIRKAFSNKDLSPIFHYDFKEESNLAKPFTTQEKYNYLVNKNPEIENLMKDLDLKLEY